MNSQSAAGFHITSHENTRLARTSHSIACIVNLFLLKEVNQCKRTNKDIFNESDVQFAQPTINH